MPGIKKVRATFHFCFGYGRLKSLLSSSSTAAHSKIVQFMLIKHSKPFQIILIQL
jgi:hypothetical protein